MGKYLRCTKPSLSVTYVTYRVGDRIKSRCFPSNRTELNFRSIESIQPWRHPQLVICPQRPSQSPTFAGPTNALRFSSYIMLDFAKFFLPFPPILTPPPRLRHLPAWHAVTLRSTPRCHPLLPTPHIVSHFQYSLPTPLATNTPHSLLTFLHRAPSHHQTSNDDVQIRLRKKLLEWRVGDWLDPNCAYSHIFVLDFSVPS